MLFKLWIGLTIGNFIWQALKYILVDEFDGVEAVKISLYQGVALFVAALIL